MNEAVAARLPRFLDDGKGGGLERADEALELALSAAEAPEEDAEVLPPVALVEELAADFEAVDEAVSESVEDA